MDDPGLTIDYATSVLHLADMTTETITDTGTEPPVALTAPKGQGEILKPAEILGHLLIVKPLEFIPEMQTAFGASDAIRCDVVDLQVNNEDGSWGKVSQDVLWFGRTLVGGLRKQLGDMVLGWMAQGIGKPGQSPPYVLSDAMGNGDAVRVAQQWLDTHPEFSAAPTTPATVPAATPATTPSYSAPAAKTVVVQQIPATVGAQQAVPTVGAQQAVPTVGVPATVPVPTSLPVPAASTTVTANSALSGLSDEQRSALEALGYKVP